MPSTFLVKTLHLQLHLIENYINLENLIIRKINSGTVPVFPSRCRGHFLLLSIFLWHSFHVSAQVQSIIIQHKNVYSTPVSPESVTLSLAYLGFFIFQSLLTPPLCVICVARRIHPSPLLFYVLRCMSICCIVILLPFYIQFIRSVNPRWAAWTAATLQHDSYEFVFGFEQHPSSSVLCLSLVIRVCCIAWIYKYSLCI